MSQQTVFNTRITIRHLIDQQSKVYSDGNGLSDIEEIDNEYNHKPSTVEELIMDGLRFATNLVLPQISEQYSVIKQPIEQSPIYHKTKRLLPYVLKNYFYVLPDEMDIKHHSSVLSTIKPEQGEAHLEAAPQRIETAVTALHNLWLDAERQLGMHHPDRPIEFRAFSIFASFAYAKFRLEFGHHGDIAPCIGNTIWNTGYEPTFSVLDLANLLSRSKKHVSEDMNSFRIYKRLDEKPDANKLPEDQKIRLRAFNETYQDNRYPEVEYFTPYYKNGPIKQFFPHSTAVCFLRDYKKNTQFKFTEFRYLR